MWTLAGQWLCFPPWWKWAVWEQTSGGEFTVVPTTADCISQSHSGTVSAAADFVIRTKRRISCIFRTAGGSRLQQADKVFVGHIVSTLQRRICHPGKAANCRSTTLRISLVAVGIICNPRRAFRRSGRGKRSLVFLQRHCVALKANQWLFSLKQKVKRKRRYTERIGCDFLALIAP